MTFSIEQVVLWPRGKHPVCAYDFKPGVINLITGAKQTGRTSFVNIIDYVFGSNECDLPDAFNPSTDIVGVVALTESSRYLFVRAVPAVGRKCSDSCDLVELPKDGPIRLPVAFEMKYAPEDVRWQLNRIVCGEFGGDDSRSAREQSEIDDIPQLTFRDVFNFSLQDDTTIADRHCLVKGIHENGGGLAAKMKPYFPFILGVIDRSIVELENEKRKLEKDLKTKGDERVKTTRALKNCLQSLEEMLHSAKAMSICPPDVNIPDWGNPDGLVALARSLTAKTRGIVPPKLVESELDEKAKRVKAVQEELRKLAVESQAVQDKIEHLKDVDSKVKSIIETGEKTRQRLEISEWVSQYWKIGKLASWGGFDAEEIVRKRIDCLKEAVSRYGASVTSPEKQADYRAAFEREMSDLEARRKKLIRDHAAKADELGRLCSEEGEAKKFLAAQREAFEMIGAIRNAAETWEKLNGSDNSDESLAEIRHQIGDLELKIAKRRADEERLNTLCRRFISTRIMERLKTLFVNPDLLALKPDFDTERFTLRFIDGQKTRHFSNVGASSNYICFHVAASCALMEQFGQREDTPVQNFVLFDIPALEDGLDENGEPLHYVEQLIGTLEESEHDVRESKSRPWQPILLLQTPSSLSPDGELVHVVAHFNEGTGIIPNDWLT